MNANLTFPSISTLSPNGGNVAPTLSPTDGDAKTEEFAAVLTGQMFKAERQGLAAQALGGPGLQVVSLGAKLNVITTDEPLPDLPSLATFARAQGLDEVAIQALFGPTIGPKNGVTISGVGPSYATKTVPSLALAAALPQLGKSNFLAINTSLIEQDPAALVKGHRLAAPCPESSPKVGGLNPLKDALFDLGESPAQKMESVDLAQVNPDQAQMSLDMTQATLAPEGNNPQLASTTVPAPIGQPLHESRPELTGSGRGPIVTLALPASIQKNVLIQTKGGLAIQSASRQQVSGMPLTASSGAAVRATDQASATERPVGIAIAAWVPLEPTGTKKTTEARSDMQLSGSAEESIQDAIRLSITMPAKDIAKRGPNTIGTTEKINWSGVLAGPSANKGGVSNAWEDLHLTVPEGFDLDEPSGTLASWDQDTITAPSTTQTADGPQAKQGAAAAHTLRGEPSTIAAQTELRAVQQQQLADRLGEAAAHRLIAQIERGEWKMQMRLQPGKLGKIDIELTMQARGLEAMFSADSALTRELIVQGSTRLKDTLTQAGMTVASVTVNGDQASQSGGNSTPRHGNPATASAEPAKVRAEAPLVSPEASPTRTNDRLNILA